MSSQSSTVEKLLKRSRLGDTVAVSAFVIVLSVVPFVLLYTDESRHFHDSRLQFGYTVSIAMSWPFLLLATGPLGYFWMHGRSVDSVYFSRATRGQLGFIQGAVACVGVGCIAGAIGMGFWIAEIAMHGRDNIVLIYGVLSLLLLVWITVQLFFVMWETVLARKQLSLEAQSELHAESSMELPN